MQLSKEALSIVFRESLRRELRIGRHTAIGGAPPDRRVTTENKKQKALKTQCFQGFLVVRVKGLEPSPRNPDRNLMKITSR